MDVEPALLEAELSDHDVVEQADDVGAGADDVVGVGERALERARAAEPLAALEHEHGLAGPREVGGAGQAVVAAADDDRVPVAGGELLHGRGQADLAQLLGDGVHCAVSLATASTTTAPSFVDEDGVALDQLEAGDLRERGRQAGGGGEVGAREQRRRRGGCGARALDALGRRGERDDGDVVERLGVDAAEADHERGHDGVAAHGDDQLGAGRRHPLDQHLGAAVAADERAVGGAERRLGGDVERQRPGGGLVLQRGARELDRDRAAELGERGHGVVLAGDDAAVDDGDAGGAEERLRLVLGEPAAERGQLADRARDAGPLGRRGDGPEAAPDGSRGARRRSSRSRSASGAGAWRAAAQARPVRRPASGGHAGLGEAPGGGVVEQLGEGGGDEHGTGLASAPSRRPSSTACQLAPMSPSRLGGWS